MGRVIMSGRVPKLVAPVNILPLNDYTWEQISAIANAGQAASYFSVGDTKTITINGKVGATTFSALEIDVFILGFDHNSGIEGANTIHFGLGKISGVDVCLCDGFYGNNTTTASGYFTMIMGNTNSGGWASSHMRTTVLGSDATPDNPTENTLLAALPSDLLAVLKPVTKYTDNTGGGKDTASYVTATEEYLPLLAEFEVFGTRTYANSAEQNYQEQYAYYAAGNSKVKCKHDATTTAAYWRLRSVYATNTSYFAVVYTTGRADYALPQKSYGVAPLFVVGGESSGDSGTTKPIPVTITGTGNSSKCYVKINGTVYTSAASVEVMPGDVIALMVYGWDSDYRGYIEVDGESVVSSGSNTQAGYYELTVLDTMTSINIVLEYSSSNYISDITVTTS